MSNVHEFTLFQKDKKMQKITAKDSGILAIGNSKGGVGKSTFSVHCAFFFAEKGYKVALIDLDNQGNSSKHLLKYNKEVTLPAYVKKSETNTVLKGNAVDLFLNELSDSQLSINSGAIAVFQPNLALANINNSIDTEKTATFKENISKLLKHKTIIIFDTPPTLGNLLLIPLSVSHLVVMPTLLKSYAVDGISEYIAFAQKIKKAMNPDLVLGGVVPNLVNKKSEVQKTALADLNRDGKASNLIYLENDSILHFTEKNVIEEAAELGIATWHIQKNSTRPVKKTFFTLFKQISKQLKLAADK